MGRPRKGDRVAIAAKPERPLAEVLQHNATLLGLSYGDYLVNIAAHLHGMPEYAPQPTKTLDTLEGLAPESAAVIRTWLENTAQVTTPPTLTTAEELQRRIAS